MQLKRRWLTSVVKEAAKAKIDMPWTRGPSRAANIEQRKAQPTLRTAQS